MTSGTLAGSAHEEHADHYDPQGAKIGMWLFLFTELMLFGTLFIAFAVYLYQYRPDFMASSHHLDRVLGAVNTLILLTSSLTVVLAIGALERANKKLCLSMLGATIVFALGFLVIKSYEWSEKFAHDLYPLSATMLEKNQGEQLFYGLYFSMTGLHALHVIIGAAVIIAAMIFIAKDKVHAGRIAFLENSGLYWHLVDVIWIFLFPLFYLIG